MWRTAAITGALFIATTAGAVSSEFARPLKIGSTGSDVRALQVVLNNTAETRVAESGPGSPGQETTYFGNKTALAVSKFQVLHRSAILTPNGLSQGTGYVGPSTLAVLNKSGTTATVTKTTPTTPSIAPTVPPTLPESKPKLLGNVEGLQGTLSVIERVGIKQGLSSAEIDKLKALVTKDVTATSTALLAAFVKQVYKDNPGQQPITLHEQLFDIARSFVSLFVPQSAYAALCDRAFNGGAIDAEASCMATFALCDALGSKSSSISECARFKDYLTNMSDPGDSPGNQYAGIDQAAQALLSGAASVSGGVPFGGKIIGTPIWCLCTASWWIPITPLPPTFPEALMYYPGSQAFLYYNIPFPPTLWLLGLYEPGPQCLIYDGDSCVPLPAQGLITPIVGSSLF